MSELLEPKTKLFEMPFLTTASYNWGLETDALNKRRAGTILHRPHEVIKDQPDGTLIHATGLRSGGQFCFIDRETGLIEYYMLFEEQSLPGLGHSATQVKLWSRSAPSGLTAEVFFDEMLGRRVRAMVSDAVQTKDGARFWNLRMRDALRRGLRVGLRDGETLTFHDVREGFAAWLARMDGWGTTEAHRARRFVIAQVEAAKPLEGGSHEAAGRE